MEAHPLLPATHVIRFTVPACDPRGEPRQQRLVDRTVGRRCCIHGQRHRRGAGPQLPVNVYPLTHPTIRPELCCAIHLLLATG